MDSPREGEVEIKRLTPIVGHFYKTALATRRIWINNEWRYFTTNPLRYVGKFVRSEHQGYGDGGRYAEIYDNGGKEIRIDYDYDGMTCLVEVEAQV
jgi:hypothetical protein